MGYTLQVDPSGEKPERGISRYSCKCGWLDGAHIRGGLRDARQILPALSQPISWTNAIPDIRVVHLARTAAPPGLPSFLQSPLLAELWAVVPERNILTQQQKINVGLGMMMQFEETYESIQSIGQLPLVSAIGWGTSGFSEEDLPSDWLGYWLGVNEWLSGKQIDNGDSSLWSELDGKCDVMDPMESDFVFDQYNNNNLFQVQWRNWWRRPRPTEVSLPASHPCSSESWPSFDMQPTRGLGGPDLSLWYSAQLSTNQLGDLIIALSDQAWLSIESGIPGYGLIPHSSHLHSLRALAC
jgi:hypothetical protein